MQTVSGTYRDGQVVLDRDVDWRNGSRIEVSLAGQAVDVQDESDSDVCFDGSRWPRTSEEIAEWLRWFDSREPLDLTPEEMARIEADRQADRQFQIEATRQSWSELEKLF